MLSRWKLRQRPWRPEEILEHRHRPVELAERVLAAQQPPHRLHVARRFSSTAAKPSAARLYRPRSRAAAALHSASTFVGCSVTTLPRQ